MSLLLEALKKAEKAKEEAQRRASAETPSAEAAQLSGAAAAAPAPAAQRKSIVTRDKLPDISNSLEILSDDLAPARPAAETPALELVEPNTQPSEAQPTAPRPAAGRRGAAPTDEAGRATAKKVFEAKFKEPNPRMPFYITVGVLGLFAVGTVVYFWYQLRPPPALVNLNPAPRAETAVATSPAAPVLSAPAAAPSANREAPIPGLPVSPNAASAPKTARSLTPAVPTSAPPPAIRARDEPAEPERLREEPRLAARPDTPKLAAAAPQAVPARPSPQVNPGVQAGYAAYSAGDLATARTHYEDALRDEPANRDALLGLAALDVRAGRYEAAEALYLRMLQTDPRNSEAQAALLALRAGRSDPLVTESRVKSLLAADPGAHALNFTLGNQFAQQSRWAEAQHEYLKAYAGEPDNADFAYNVAVSFDHLHQQRQALDYYQRAIALARTHGASFDLAAAQARAAQLAR